MSKTKWYAKPICLLVALALVLSLGIVAVPMARVAEANPALPEYQSGLEKSADYLVSRQDATGFWGQTPGGPWGKHAGSATGNAVTALLEAYQLTADPTYLVAAKKGGDYLIDVFIADDGSFDVHQAEIIGGNAYMNHLSPMLTAWIKLYEVTGQQGYRDAAVAMGDYLLTCGARCLESGPYYGLFGYLIRPTCIVCTYHGHFLNYGYEEVYGLACVYEITGDANYLQAAELEAGLEIDFQNADGSFPSLYNGIDDMSLLDIHYGSAMILAHGKLYDITGVSQYKDTVVAYVNWLLTQRNADGSFGSGDYVRSTTWAVKALLEAWRLTYDLTYLVAAEAAADWLLQPGHGYDPATGAVARYDKSTDVYVAYSQTPFIMTMAELLFRPTLTSLYFGDVALSGGFEAGHFPQVWDLTCGDLILRFTYDGNGLVDDYGGDAHAWAELGVRTVGYGDFNPTWDAEGAGVWLATDYEGTANTFDPTVTEKGQPEPKGDLDDKLILQKAGGHGEGDYNQPSAPPNPWANHGIWFDRDGVDQWQAQMWGAVDGGTYNTGGTYEVVIRLHATSSFSGTAYMTVNAVQQGFYVPNWHDGPPDLYPTGMTFTGDMMQMQVFYGLYGYGATHSVAFEDITVEGCPLVLMEGMATGGGWFIPDEGTSIGITPGGKATFGFVAKQKDNKSSGQLEFQYKTDDLNLKSTSYDWVTLSNTQVIFQGTGRLNGVDGYKFRVWAFDGDKAGGQPDRFTIRIWTGNNDSYPMPTYRAEGDLGGGNIVVHKK